MTGHKNIYLRKRERIQSFEEEKKEVDLNLSGVFLSQECIIRHVNSYIPELQ